MTDFSADFGAGGREEETERVGAVTTLTAAGLGLFGSTLRTSTGGFFAAFFTVFFGNGRGRGVGIGSGAVTRVDGVGRVFSGEAGRTVGAADRVGAIGEREAGV